MSKNLSLAFCITLGACGGASPQPDAVPNPIDASTAVDAPPGTPDAAVADASPAMAFCAAYETACTFGGVDRFSDAFYCAIEYKSFCPARQTCVEDHLGLVDVADQTTVTTHCPHATGLTACSAAMVGCP